MFEEAIETLSDGPRLTMKRKKFPKQKGSFSISSNGDRQTGSIILYFRSAISFSFKRT